MYECIVVDRAQRFLFFRHPATVTYLAMEIPVHIPSKHRESTPPQDQPPVKRGASPEQVKQKPSDLIKSESDDQQKVDAKIEDKRTIAKQGEFPPPGFAAQVEHFAGRTHGERDRGDESTEIESRGALVRLQARLSKAKCTGCTGRRLTWQKMKPRVACRMWRGERAVPEGSNEIRIHQRKIRRGSERMKDWITYSASVQYRFQLLLVPDEPRGMFRLIAIGRKYLPAHNEEARSAPIWGQMLAVGSDLKELKSMLGAREYDTKTKGESSPLWLSSTAAKIIADRTAQDIARLMRLAWLGLARTCCILIPKALPRTAEMRRPSTRLTLLTAWLCHTK